MPGKVVEINPKLTSVPVIEIDNNATFKYILCKIYIGNNTQEFRYIVRGNTAAQFHSDIYDDVDALLEESGVTCECLGGGKIQHDSAEKTIRIFGKSQGYGAANHGITAQLIQEKFKDYRSITWTDE